jgi:hypothetical protein
MKLTLKELEKCFNIAKGIGSEYVAVSVLFPKCEQPEVIINHKSNLAAKLEYYKSAYDQDLHLKTNPEVQIIGFTLGDNFAHLEAGLQQK